MSTPKVKICGNTNFEDAELAIQLGADYLGYIFAPSKRQMTVKATKEIVDRLPHFKNHVAVFFNQPKDEVESILRETGIKIAQFHGDETSRYCDFFKSQGIAIIKTFRMKDEMSLKRADEYSVDHFLVDTFDKHQPGGTGKTFNWDLIKDKAYILDQLFLAGGLTPENVREAVQVVKPFAVDVASGVEGSPGKKDPEKLKKFISALKDTQNCDEEKNPICS